jgi:hypothetical protein
VASWRSIGATAFRPVKVKDALMTVIVDTACATTYRKPTFEEGAIRCFQGLLASTLRAIEMPQIISVLHSTERI